MVKLLDVSYDRLCDSLEDHSVVCYGAGKQFDVFMTMLKYLGREALVAAVIDQCPEIYGKERKSGRHRFPIKTLKEFVAEPLPFQCLVVTNLGSLPEIIEGLDQVSIFDNAPCLLIPLIQMEETEEQDFNMLGQKIPKILHYCWFGGGEIPEQHKRYIESWKKYCPDYEIRRWDESNYDIAKNPYMYEAYQAKKWGFVPDYARLDIIYEYGGIYMDTDVELLRPLDRFLSDDMFCGFEDAQRVNFGALFGAYKNHLAIKTLLDSYEGMNFLNPDGSMNLTASPVYQTSALEKMGLVKNGRTQRFANITVYSKNYFNPYIFEIRNRHMIKDYTYSIHHYAYSWGTAEKKEWVYAYQNKMNELLDCRMGWNGQW